MCQHPSTTNNGYDTWFNGPSTVDATHVGTAETSGCTVLDCASDFRWVTHWDGSGGCCNAVDAPYTTRTGQIAIVRFYTLLLDLKQPYRFINFTC